MPYDATRPRVPARGSTLRIGRAAGGPTVSSWQMIDVTDATFEQEVLLRSSEVPVVVDLWAPWCGPCQTLGPIIERVVDGTDGAVALAKVNVDENPAISGSFQVKSIPAVFALKDGKVVDGFIGALPEEAVAEFVAKLTPAPSEADLLVDEGVRAGTEEPLRQALELQPDHPGAIAALAALLIARGESDDAIALLGRIPETPETRLLAAEARLAAQQVDVESVSRRGPVGRAPRPGPRRPVGPTGVPRPVGDARARRSPHHRLPQGPGRPPVLIAVRRTGGHGVLARVGDG